MRVGFPHTIKYWLNMDPKPDKECEKRGNTDLAIYFENSSFLWTLSGVMKPSPSMVSGVRCQASSRDFTPDTLCQCPIFMQSHNSYGIIGILPS